MTDHQESTAAKAEHAVATSEQPPRTSHDSSRHSIDVDEKQHERQTTDSPVTAEAEMAPVVPVESAKSEYLSDKKFIPVFICIYLALFLIALDRLIIATAIPTITNDFHSLGDLQWYASAYMLTGACFMLIFGRIYGYYSPKWVFLICIAIFEIGSAICGAAPNSIAFIWGRAIAGLGSAGAFSGAIIIIMFTVPMHKRPLYSGLLGSCFGVASAVGPLVGGAFTSSSATWRWCFYINLPIGGVVLLIIFLILPTIPTPGGGNKTWKEQIDNLDPLGTTVFLPSMVCLVLALQWGGALYAWSDGRVIALLVVFGITFLAFIAIQIWKGESATVPPRIIKYRSIASGVWFVFCNSSAMMVIVYFLPVWFQAIQGVSAIQSGIRTIPLVLALVLFSIGAGVAVRITGYYVPLMYGCAVLASVGAGLLTTLKVDTSEGMWIGYQVLYGAGLGMGMQQPSIAAQTVLSKKDISVGSSVIFFAQQLGGAIFVAVAQNLLDQKLISGFSAIPGFDPRMITNTGATDLRSTVPAAMLPQVLEVYNHAITSALQVGLGMSCLSIFGAIFMEWKSTKAEQKAAAEKKKEKEAGNA